MNIKAENKDKKLEFNFTQQYLDNFVQIIQRQDADSVNSELRNLHPSDSAEIISNLPDQRREDLFKIINFKIDPKIMIELTDELQREILAILDITKIKSLIIDLESDNAVHIVENIESKKRDEVLNILSEKDKEFFMIDNTIKINV